jgi:hypothetical protein
MFTLRAGNEFLKDCTFNCRLHPSGYPLRFDRQRAEASLE